MVSICELMHENEYSQDQYFAMLAYNKTDYGEENIHGVYIIWSTSVIWGIKSLINSAYKDVRYIHLHPQIGSEGTEFRSDFFHSSLK